MQIDLLIPKVERVTLDARIFGGREGLMLHPQKLGIEINGVWQGSTREDNMVEGGDRASWSGSHCTRVSRERRLRGDSVDW